MKYFFPNIGKTIEANSLVEAQEKIKLKAEPLVKPKSTKKRKNATKKD